ncbi:MAG: AAA family ATPase [archaeon]
MRILITGTPGTGKTTIAKVLAKQLRYALVNERDFALDAGIGSMVEGELELPLTKLASKLKEYLKNKNNFIIEGHVLCEIKLPIDLVFILIAKPKILEKRLSGRGYKTIKILDNLFCEETQYCEKNILKRYPQNKVFVVKNEKSLNQAVRSILNKINESKDITKIRNKRGKNE